ncbi:MAG: Ig-like domain-containing protein, partial [Candidatus Sulfotelmatobacter sp.]
NSMGGYCSSCINIDTQIVQEINNASVGVWGSPAYWNGNVYWASNNDLGTASNLMAFSFNAGNSGLLSTAPTSQSSSIFGIGTGTPVVSANGTNDGIVWLLGNAASGAKCCQVLYAFDATDLSTLLYRSSQAAGNRDVPGGAVKFTAPVVANGKVYVGSQMQVSAYGLIATTKSTVTASANPGYVTQPITYTATVTGLNGTPTGSVVFYQGSTALATVPLSNGQATYSTTYATNGTNLISAAYSGAAGVSYPSTSPVLKEVVNLLPAVTTTKLTVAPTSIYVGQSVALTATVSSTFGTPPNGETVTFTSGGVTLGTGSLNGGVATLTTSALAAADHLMVAIYSGDANFKSSQGTDTTEVVNKYPTTTVINSSPNPSTSGQATILTAQVTTSGPSTPTGWVTFRYGTTSLGVAAVNGSGVATLTIKNIPLGSNSLTASYTDSPMYANSVSAPITQIVNQP